MTLTDFLLLILIAISAANWLEFRRLRKKLLAFFVMLMSWDDAIAQQPQPKGFVGPPKPKEAAKPELKRLWMPRDAYAAVAADLERINPIQRLTTRYIWIQQPSANVVKFASADLNRVSRSATVFRPVPIANNQLLRIDLTWLTFDLEKETKDVVDTWEELRFDPAFNLLLEPDAQKLVLGVPVKDQPKVLIWKGKKLEPTTVDAIKDTPVIRIPAPHLDLLDVIKVQEWTQSSASIVGYEYFSFRAQNQVQGADDVYKAVFSGLYYRFLGLDKLAKKGETDIDALLRYVGADGTQTAEQRIGIETSQVTGKPRAIFFAPARTRGALDGRSAISITEDVFDESIRASQDAMQTLDRDFFKPDAFEIIWTMRNGFNGYAVANAQKKFADEALQAVVTDSTVPKPHTARLQPAGSCIRCHETAHDGWQPAKNDVLTRFQAKKGKLNVDVFGDAKAPNVPINRTLQNLAAQYQAQPDRFLQEARFGYQRAMLEATGLFDKAKPTDVVKLAAKGFESRINDWRYGRVTPAKALNELGFTVIPPEEAQPYLRRLLPPRIQDQAFGIVPADSIIDNLADGFDANRFQWSLRQAFAQLRAQQSLAEMMIGKKQ